MGKDDLLLVDGGLVYVPQGFSSSDQGDVIRALLYCSLYAKSKFNMFAEARSWNARHNKALLNLKWNRERDRTIVLEQSGAGFVLRKLLEEKLYPVLGSGPAQDVESVVAGVEQLSAEHGSWKALRAATVLQNSGEEGAPASQVVVRVNLLGAAANIYSIFIHFKTNEEVDADFFNQPFEAVDNLSIDVAQYSLNTEAYKKGEIRTLVLEQLLDALNKKVISLGSTPADDKFVGLL